MAPAQPADKIRAPWAATPAAAPLPPAPGPAPPRALKRSTTPAATPAPAESPSSPPPAATSTKAPRNPYSASLLHPALCHGLLPDRAQPQVGKIPLHGRRQQPIQKSMRLRPSIRVFHHHRILPYRRILRGRHQN